MLIENRHGLLVQTDVRAPGYHAEREATLTMVDQLPPRRQRTLGANKDYDEPDLIAALRKRGVTPHVSPNPPRYGKQRQSPIDGRTTRHPGYALSQQKRKLVEEGFGWEKCTGLLRELRHRCQQKVAWVLTFTGAVYNLARLRTLLTPVAA